MSECCAYLSAGVTFGDPYGVAVDGYGNVYMADWRAVVKLTPEGEEDTNFPAKDVSFGTPSDVAVDGYGNVYV